MAEAAECTLAMQFQFPYGYLKTGLGAAAGTRWFAVSIPLRVFDEEVKTALEQACNLFQFPYGYL